MHRNLPRQASDQAINLACPGRLLTTTGTQCIRGDACALRGADRVSLRQVNFRLHELGTAEPRARLQALLLLPHPRNGLRRVSRGSRGVTEFELDFAQQRKRAQSIGVPIFRRVEYLQRSPRMIER